MIKFTIKSLSTINFKHLFTQVFSLVSYLETSFKVY